MMTLPWWMDLCLAVPLAAFSDLLIAGIRKLLDDWTSPFSHVYAEDLLLIAILIGLLLLTMRLASRRSYTAMWLAALLLLATEFARALTTNASLM